FERTPSVAGAFGAFESMTETRFAADGVTPLGAPIRFVHAAAGDLQTSRGATWTVAYDHRFSSAWSLHAGVLNREGTHGLIVEPIRTAMGGELLLHSNGASTYRD